MSESTSSYRQIFRSSSVMAVAQFIQYGVGLVRNKAAALLIGPAGVGVLGMYVAITTLVNTASGLGIGSSGVRAIAEARGASDGASIARAVHTVRRVAWWTGSLGALALVVAAVPASDWAFGHGGHASAMLGLGATVFFTALENAEASVLQGMQRVEDLAKRTVLQAVLVTAMTIGGYLAFGVRAVVAILAASAAANYCVTRWLGRGVQVGPDRRSLRETLSDAGPLVRLGAAFMWAGLVTSISAFAIRSLVVRWYAMDAAGLYQAAWAISGLFASLVLTAMGSDFYPRLATAARDSARVNELVNQQTEIGLLLATPGIVATLTLAPWLIQVLYSRDFGPSTALLPGFVLGVVGRVVSWPMGYVLVARDESRAFAILETSVGLLHVALAGAMMAWLGVQGAAWAFASLYAIYTATVAVIVRRATGFSWSPAAKRLIAMAAVLVGASLTTFYALDGLISTLSGVTLTTVTTLLALRALSARLGEGHRLVRILSRIPGGRWFVPEPSLNNGAR